MEEANSSFSACGSTERHPAADQVYLIEEANRAGELMPIMEDEHGTYIMNSKDLRAIEYIEKLTKIGVTSLKIEGYQVAILCGAYRSNLSSSD